MTRKFLTFRLRTALIAVTVVCILGAYVRAYLELLKPAVIVTESAGGIGIGFREAHYRSGGRVSQAVFAPAHFIDRRLRANYWNSWCSIDEEESEREDHPWGWIEFVDGEMVAVNIRVKDRSDLAILDRMVDCDELGFVSIRGEAFSDADLSKLTPLTKLCSLELLGTRVSRLGAQRIRRELPNCSVDCISVTDSGSEVY